ncbi:fructosamine kinase [Alloscardovia theropitheci]|uniref:Fructosamine kinase n=1 Tax=Alloscardovia theropitheci TaxID=2496842 RepID=A0A4R0QWI2_9BIFI|nr:fructosamine kinase family protein [Alloscardovia theropitheci]TCD54767.1 fructosamine kinase [Alloscardovia theropitheci]
MSSKAIHRKTRVFAPEGFFECEAKGLMWLKEAQVHGGPRVVDVESCGSDFLDIERISAVSATPDAAYQFGRDLAHMHDFGADYFGQAPDHYTGKCYFGPLQDPVVMDTGQWNNVVDYFAQGRLIPMVKLGISRGLLTSADLELTERVSNALPDLLGSAGQDKPARVHGDLWSGNVMWTSTASDGTPLDSVEAVLIDPAAHGGHREEDLSMLSLFGMSFMSDILRGYQTVHPLKKGFEERRTLWQLYPIAGHCVFFGGGYISQYRSMCKQLLTSL